VRTATEAHCAPVVIVVGGSGNTIRDSLRETSAVIIDNPEWERGLGTSIRCGLKHLVGSSPATDAVILLACDQPLVEPATITALLTAQEQTKKPIVASSYAGTLGVPALFESSCFGELLALPDDSGAKSLIASRPNDVAAIVFEEGAIDIDMPSDFQRLTAESE